MERDPRLAIVAGASGDQEVGRGKSRHVGQGSECHRWLLLSRDGEWRWLLGREDSPWYPSMRIFRQRSLGNWNELVARVGTALAHFRSARQ